MKKLPHPEVKPDYSHHTDFYHPPLLPMPDIPMVLHYGSYLAKRKYDVHTGVDLYAPVGSAVYAIETGEVVKIRPFTGEHAGSPFWDETWDVAIEGFSGVMCYGEIKPEDTYKEGDIIEKGTLIGRVLRVLRKDKGKAMSMLHFSLHRPGWKYLIADQENSEKESFYDLQLDPTMLLLQLKMKADWIVKNKREKGDWI